MEIFLFYRGNESYIIKCESKYVAHVLHRTKFAEGFEMESIPNLQVMEWHIDETFNFSDIKVDRHETVVQYNSTYSLLVYVKSESFHFQHFEENFFVSNHLNLQLEDYINMEEIPLLELDEEDFTEVNSCTYCCNGKHLVESGNDPTDPDMVECDEHDQPFGYSPF